MNKTKFTKTAFIFKILIIALSIFNSYTITEVYAKDIVKKETVIEFGIDEEKGYYVKINDTGKKYAILKLDVIGYPYPSSINYLFIATDKKTVVYNENVFKENAKPKYVILQAEKKDVFKYYNSIYQAIEKHVFGQPPHYLHKRSYTIQLFDINTNEDEEIEHSGINMVQDYHFKPFHKTKWHIERKEFNSEKENELWENEKFLKFREENWNYMMQKTEEFVEHLKKTNTK